MCYYVIAGVKKIPIKNGGLRGGVLIIWAPRFGLDGFGGAFSFGAGGRGGGDFSSVGAHSIPWLTLLKRHIHRKSDNAASVVNLFRHTRRHLPKEEPRKSRRKFIKVSLPPSNAAIWPASARKSKHSFAGARRKSIRTFLTGFMIVAPLLPGIALIKKPIEDEP